MGRKCRVVKMPFNTFIDPAGLDDILKNVKCDWSDDELKRLESIRKEKQGEKNAGFTREAD